MKYFVFAGIWCLVMAAILLAQNHKKNIQKQIKTHHEKKEFPCTLVTTTGKHVAIFNNCNSLTEARSWLNEPGRATFINLGNTVIVNVDDIIRIDPKYKANDWDEQNQLTE